MAGAAVYEKLTRVEGSASISLMLLFSETSVPYSGGPSIELLIVASHRVSDLRKRSAEKERTSKTEAIVFY